jgi:hypothetical protein
MALFLFTDEETETCKRTGIPEVTQLVYYKPETQIKLLPVNITQPKTVRATL